MPNVNVYLDCRNSAAVPGDGYTNSSATNGATYCYKYSGGTDGNGNVTEYTDDGSGQATITITCGGDPRYVINNIGFNGNIPNDFSWAHGIAANVATITDTDVDNGNMYFVVTIQDTTADCTFGCDPGVTNTTRPPL